MEHLKKFDFFPKLSEEVEVKKTSQGGAIFSVFGVIIGALCLIELYTFILGDPIVEPYISKSRIDEKVRVNLNISLFETPCEALGLDFQDITGSHFEDLQQTIYKLELNKDGYVVDHNKFEEVKKFESKNFHPSHPLWERITGKLPVDSCYGAELYQGQKCTTCQDVIKAYRSRGWPIPLTDVFAQCANAKKDERAHVHALGQGIKIQLPGQPQRKLGEVSSNFTQNTLKPQNLFKDENTPQFSLINSLFVIQDVMSDNVFTFDIMRSLCQLPQEAVIEFTFTDYLSDETKTIQSKPIHFAGGECKIYFPLKIVHIHGQELILESFLLEKERLHIKIQNNDDLFKIRILNPIDSDSENKNVEIPSATFKRGISTKNIYGRMLHAEFYGFDDTHPTLITPFQVEYLKSRMGTGCQIVGTMFIKKVPGNFHISTHHKGLGLQYVEQNLTAKHKIHLLEFTTEDGEISLGKYARASNFLDGTLLPPPVAHDIHYYMKIIQSTYKHSIWGEKRFYEYVAHVDVTPKQRNVVLLEFKYEFDPISMRYVNGRKSLSGFFISLLAIIGGIFASSTLIDRILERK